jgi:acyl-CoA synthetase (AMP-forming)/AMP-acid ligase II
MGEVGMAFVVLRPGAAATPPAIIEWCRGEMANYKVPRFVEIVDALPLNATGKVLKYELREQGTKIASGSTP